MRKVLGIIFCAALMVGLVGVVPASARPGGTVTVTCSGGQVIVSDIMSFFGQTTANFVYNQVNPFDPQEFCETVKDQ